jgi:hypothetical protein
LYERFVPFSELGKDGKEVVVAYFKVLAWYSSEGLRKSIRMTCQDSRSVGQDFKLRPPKYMTMFTGFCHKRFKVLMLF